VIVVVVGTGIGFAVASLNNIVQWIVTALYGGYTAANVLKWYWWRFNSYGYFWGMVGGIIGSMLVPLLLPGVAPIFAFPVILVLSVAGCVIGTLATPPDDDEVLKNFYRRVRPWGFWRPIHEKVAREHPGLVPNRNFARDMTNVAVGIVWQTAQVALGIYLVLKDWNAVVICVAVVLVGTVVLKFNWYDKLEDYPADLFEPAHDNVDARADVPVAVAS
jgi:SSS family solute:Na+ symporter